VQETDQKGSDLGLKPVIPLPSPPRAQLRGLQPLKMLQPVKMLSIR
jgi:hypothetical protein